MAPIMRSDKFVSSKEQKCSRFFAGENKKRENEKWVIFNTCSANPGVQYVRNFNTWKMERTEKWSSKVKLIEAMRYVDWKQNQNKKLNNQSNINVEAFSTVAKTKIGKWSHTCFVSQRCCITFLNNWVSVRNTFRFSNSCFIRKWDLLGVVPFL